jgi:pimeloyl-ACP methyl ester carboxylesterase
VKANNGAKTLGGNAGLTNINGKPINLVKVGKQDGSPIVFIHGLGGSKDFWTPLIKTSGLDTDHQIYLYDFEGHGLTPTSPKHKISITSLTKDVRGVFDHANIELNGTLIAHYMGCLVALDSVLSNPGRVSKLVLVGPPPAPLPDAASKATHARAALVRQKGMAAVVDAVAAAGTSSATQRSIPMAYTGVGLSLLAQDPEGYAKACTALAEASQAFDRAAVDTDILIITGSEDKVSPVSLCEQYAKNSSSRGRNLEVLSEVGHWHVFEDPAGVAKHIKSSFG